MAESEPSIEDNQTTTLPSEDNYQDEEKLHTVQLNGDEKSPVLAFRQDDDDDEKEETESHTTQTTTSTRGAATATTIPSSDTTPDSSSNGGGMTNFIEGTQLQGKTAVTKTLAASTVTLKEWSFQQYKVTKQVLSERLGKSLKTVDASLESRLEGIRDTQRKYQQLMSLSGQLQMHMQKVVDTQKSLAEHFAFLSVRCPELDAEFEFNSETQKKIARNGETLVSSLKFFISNVYTVSAKSIEDTLTTAKQYETARVLYDAYRSDLDNITKASQTSQVIET